MTRTLFIAPTLLVVLIVCADADEPFVLTTSNSVLWKDNSSYDAIYLPDGNSVIIDGWLWDCRTQKLLRRLNDFHPGQERFALSPSGKTLALIDQGFRGPGSMDHWC